MENKLLDFNAYDTWKKDLPSNMKGFNELRKKKLPEYDIDTDDPHEFAEYVWQFIFDDELEPDKVVKITEDIIQKLEAK